MATERATLVRSRFRTAVRRKSTSSPHEAPFDRSVRGARLDLRDVDAADAGALRHLYSLVAQLRVPGRLGRLNLAASVATVPRCWPSSTPSAGRSSCTSPRSRYVNSPL